MFPRQKIWKCQIYYANLHRFFRPSRTNNNTHIIKMKFNFNSKKEYTAPVCRVYSVNLEGAIAKLSSGDDVPPAEEDDWGDL